MARVYFEASFFSACVTKRSTPRAQYEREMSLAWLEAEEQGNDLFLADPVINELSDPGFRERESALNLASQYRIEPITAAMEAFAIILAQRFVMPQDLQGDALHVAAAVLLQADILLTWNVKHLANENKQPHLRAVCVENGLVAPRITRPDILLQEAELS
jgi:hypothetical protein